MIDQTQLDAAKASVTSALQTFNANKAKLLTHDGKPILEPAAHARAVEKAGEPLRAAVEKALALGDAAIAEVEKGRLNQHADPMAALDLANLELAATHRVFVKEDCETLPVPDLVGRLAWAAAHPGKYYRVLYARYALARFQSMVNAKPQPAGIPELRAALEALGAIGQSRGLSPELQRLSENAAQLKRWAGRELQIAANPEQDAKDRAAIRESIRSIF